MPDEIIDKGSAIPRVSWAVFLTIMAFVVAGTRFQTRMDDVADRQQKYVERRDQQHAAQQELIEMLEAEIESTHDRMDALCQEVAARWQEVVC